MTQCVIADKLVYDPARPHHSDSVEEDISSLPNSGDQIVHAPSDFSPSVSTHQAQGNSPRFASYSRYSPQHVEYLYVLLYVILG